MVRFHLGTKVMKKIIFCLLTLFLIVFFLPFPQQRRAATPDFELRSLKFPKDFLWGAGTAAHQVEGNTKNQITQWETQNAERLASEAAAKFAKIVPDWDAIKTEATDPQNYISGQAAGHYEHYAQDIALMREIGLNAYRFSIEWSRIEPEDDKFDGHEIEHYRSVILELKKQGIEPIITIWHRTQPEWVNDQGEWESEETIEDYVQFAELLAREYGNDVEYWITFNEPILHLVVGYILGVLPPEVKSLTRANRVIANMEEAHRRAYKAIHNIDSDSMVGSTQAMQVAEGSPNTITNAAIAKYLENYSNWKFLDATKAHTDFIGIQYYAPSNYRLKWGRGIADIENFHDLEAQIKSDMGWEVYPAGIYKLLTETHQRYGKPIIITENGFADRSDKFRADYIKNHLYETARAISNGAHVRGYVYWGLLDFLEWDKGFWPRFGLIEVDYNDNLKRTIRPSARVYKEIIRQSQ